MKTNERVVIDKNQPYEYNIATYILQELCSEGIIDIFDLSEALIILRKIFLKQAVADKSFNVCDAAIFHNIS